MFYTISDYKVPREKAICKINVFQTRILSGPKLEEIHEEIKFLKLKTNEFLNNTSDGINKWYNLQNKLLKIIEKVSPNKNIRLKKRELPWFDEELHTLKQTRDKLHKMAMKTSHKKESIQYKAFVECRTLLQKKLRQMCEHITDMDFESPFNLTIDDSREYINKLLNNSRRYDDLLGKSFHSQ